MSRLRDTLRRLRVQAEGATRPACFTAASRDAEILWDYIKELQEERRALKADLANIKELQEERRALKADLAKERGEDGGNEHPC